MNPIAQWRVCVHRKISLANDFKCFNICRIRVILATKLNAEVEVSRNPTKTFPKTSRNVNGPADPTSWQFRSPLKKLPCNPRKWLAIWKFHDHTVVVLWTITTQPKWNNHFTASIQKQWQIFAIFSWNMTSKIFTAMLGKPHLHKLPICPNKHHSTCARHTHCQLSIEIEIYQPPTAENVHTEICNHKRMPENENRVF